MSQQPTTSSLSKPLPPRLASLDAFRGFVMIAMASSGFGLARVARKFPDNDWWQTIGFQFEHVEWRGWSFWDLIQPSFMFMVGVSMAFSYAARASKGQSYGRMLLHAAIRALVLILLGIFLRSNGRVQTYFTFEDVLTQIGLGYVFLFLLWGRPLWVQGLATIAILAGYWALFWQYPVPPEGFDYTQVGVSQDWEHFEGLEQHWDKNTNPAADFDVWFLNLFPREEPFRFNGGGYQTLNFIPSLATMIIGLMVGGQLRSRDGNIPKLIGIVVAGLILGAGGLLLDQYGYCPLVKRIWTPSWAIFSAGAACLLLAAFYLLVDILRLKPLAWPLIVVGMNSIVMYVLAGLSAGWALQMLKTHLGASFFEQFGVYAPIAERVSVVLVFWLFCAWLYRQRIFVRI